MTKQQVGAHACLYRYICTYIDTYGWMPNRYFCLSVQAYDALRAQRDAEREAQEAAQEAEIAAAAAARAKHEEEEAEKWRSLFTVEEKGQEALTQEEGEVG